MNVDPTIVVLHEHAGVVELIEAALREPAVVLNVEPMWLDEIAHAVITALPPRREHS